MTVQQDLWQILRRLEHADIPAEDRESLRPAFAALHGCEAVPLDEAKIARIRALDAYLGE
ncbi:hypothetical protein ACFSHT_22195 [Paraburkholderia silviterrae]|uniref:Uncharacterized protein n=1 Tax=Paraburkholderia silviterrae TaxID=2528715 RepID=A0A4R5MF68_9BURK|nr:hypothetical protein [Paraburkholderia silviterrae]TDG25901.1 hypothetical protein EYW47_00585 [Paraburkholderia silviterrae]